MPSLNGRYCGNCSKVVVDFTKMSDEEVISYFRQRPKDTCGRFRAEQLTNYSLRDATHFFTIPQLLKAGVLSFIFLLFSKQAITQTKNTTEKIENRQDTVSSNFMGKTKIFNDVHLSGLVLVADDDSEMPGVNIILKGSTEGVTSDADGHFTFPQKLKAGDKLVVSFIGFQSVEHTVSGSQANEEIIIRMNYDTARLGKVVVTGMLITTNRISFRRWWWKLKG